LAAHSEVLPSGGETPVWEAGAVSLRELSDAIHAGRIGPLELTRQFLERIDRLNGTLKAYSCVTRERALAEADAAEAAIRCGDSRGPLHGIPYAVKEHFDVRGVPTMVGTPLLADNIAAEDSMAVRKLGEAGMVLLGKTHSVQLGCGTTGINQQLGTPHNPWHRVPHVPGGSSSGSAVAVAAGLAPVALGGDAGGSVRVPAALCGTVGFKPTVGRISRAGVYPTSTTLDTVGVLSRFVEDAALVYDALQGPDPEDEATAGAAPQAVTGLLPGGIEGLCLAFPTNVLFKDADPEVEAAVREAGRVLAGLGARVIEIAIPELDEVQGLADRFAISAVETYAQNEWLFRKHAAELDPVLSWMTAAREIRATDYFRVLQLHHRLRRRVLETLEGVDAVLAPATLIPALPVQTVAPDAGVYVERYQDDFSERYVRNAAMGNFLGLCGLSLPCGFSSAGLPIGLHIYGKPQQESLVLRIATAYEQASAWSGRHPDLAWVR